MRTLTYFFAISLMFNSIVGCGSRSVDPNPNPSSSASASANPDVVVSAEISPTLDTNDAVVAEVTKLEKEGKVTDVLIRESFPVQISLKAKQSIVDQLKAMAAGQSGNNGGDVDLNFESLSNKNISRVKTEKQVVVKSAAEFSTLWQEHNGSSENQPDVDFGSDMVVAVFMGEKATGGYNIEITSVSMNDSQITVEYSETEPDPDGFTTQVITSPAHIVKIKKSDVKVAFTKK